MKKAGKIIFIILTIYTALFMGGCDMEEQNDEGENKEIVSEVIIENTSDLLLYIFTDETITVEPHSSYTLKFIGGIQTLFSFQPDKSISIQCRYKLITPDSPKIIIYSEYITNDFLQSFNYPFYLPN